MRRLAIVCLSVVLVGWNFPQNTGLVVDQADVLTSDQEARLGNELTSLQANDGVRLQIVTVNSLEGATVDVYARALFATYHAEAGTRHAIVVFAPNERKIHLDWSRPLNDVLTPDVEVRIRTGTIVPRWRAGQGRQAEGRGGRGNRHGAHRQGPELRHDLPPGRGRAQERVAVPLGEVA